MELSEKGNIRVSVKLNVRTTGYEQGLVGPITRRGTRYLFVITKQGCFEVGQTRLDGTLIDEVGYKADNTRDAKYVLAAIASMGS